MNRNKLPEHSDMVTAIVGYYNSASAAQRADGAAWYTLARGIVDAIATAILEAFRYLHNYASHAALLGLKPVLGDLHAVANI